MSSNLVKDPHASSSKTERNETPATLQEETPQTNAPNETTSAVEGVKEPVYPGSKLFRVNIGSQNDPMLRCSEKDKSAPQYLHLSHDLAKKDKSAQENKRQIFDGFYNCDVPVAILKILRNNHSGTTQKELERECQILKELEVHENFIRYIAHEWDEDFEYIATERCLFSVADLLDTDHMREVSIKNEILKELGAKEILRQATRGLHYLHQNDFIHRNIKPNNFLIKEINKIGDSPRRFVVKITDFRITRKRNPNPSQQDFLSGSVASQGWEAPESKNENKELSTKLDVFILGCFYHYVLIALSKNGDNNGKSRHPFGDNEAQRVPNIQNLNYSVYKDKPPFNPENKDEEEVTKLIKLMLKFKEDERPTLQKVLDSSYYNPSEDYKLYEDYKSPGLCVIFNQQVFRLEKKNREGSDKDRDALSDTFKKLGFNTEVHENLESFDLKSEINALAKRNFSDFGCLIVCLLSHGIENAILCYDGRYVNTNELKNEFSFNNCPSLYGKPKIFIVQACQGQLRQSKTDIIPHTTTRLSFFSKLYFPRRIYQYFTDQSTNKEIDSNNQKEKLKEVLEILEDAPRNPPLMDFITIKSTLPGFVSYRLVNKDKNGQVQEYLGSSFIQAFCETLSEEYFEKKEKGRKHMELEGLLRSVQLKINKVSERIDWWQTMQWEACLRKYIRFRECEAKDINVEFRN